MPPAPSAAFEPRSKAFRFIATNVCMVFSCMTCRSNFGLSHHCRTANTILQVFMDRQKGLNVQIQAFWQHRNRLGIQNLCRLYGGRGVKVGALRGCYYLHTVTVNCTRLVSASSRDMPKVARVKSLVIKDTKSAYSAILSAANAARKGRHVEQIAQLKNK